MLDSTAPNKVPISIAFANGLQHQLSNDLTGIACISVENTEIVIADRPLPLLDDAELRRFGCRLLPELPPRPDCESRNGDDLGE